MRSPIKDVFRFAGSQYLLNIIPRGSLVNSLKLYSGAIELFLADNDRFVVGSTTRYVVYEFWHCMMEDPKRVAQLAAFLKKTPIGTDMPITYVVQEKWAEYKDPYIRAALFFLLNRFSSSGLVSAGGIDEANFGNFNPNSIHRLKSFQAKNFFLNYKKDIDYIDNTPEGLKVNYNMITAGQFGYNFFEEGKSKTHEYIETDHQRIKDFLTETPTNTIALYEPHDGIKGFYKGLEVVSVNENGKPTSEDASGVIVANFRIS